MREVCDGVRGIRSVVCSRILWCVLLLGGFGPALLGQGPIFVSPADITSVVDEDGDGNVSQLAIEYQLQNRLAGVEVEVFSRVHYREITPTSRGAWKHIFTSPESVIEGINIDEVERVEVQSDRQGLYEYRISAFVVGRSLPVAKVIAGEVRTEPPVMDRYGLRISRFASPPRIQETLRRDYDQDGYASEFTLEYSLELTESSQALRVYDKIYWRESGTEPWILYYDTSKNPYPVPGENRQFRRSMRIETGARGVYDYRVEVYLPGLSDPLLTSDSETNYRLQRHREELPREDCWTSSDWLRGFSGETDVVDSDGDGYANKKTFVVALSPDVDGPVKAFVRTFRWHIASDQWNLIGTSEVIDFSNRALFAEDELSFLGFRSEILRRIPVDYPPTEQYFFEVNRVFSRSGEIVRDGGITLWHRQWMESPEDDKVFHRLLRPPSAEGLIPIPNPAGLRVARGIDEDPVEANIADCSVPDPEVILPRVSLDSSIFWIGDLDQDIELIATISENNRPGLRVEFWSDGDSLGGGGVSGDKYSLKLRGLHEGFHFITAKVTTPEGIVVESNEIEVAVLTNSDSSDSYPAVKLEASRDRVTPGESVDVIVRATDSEGPILMVELLVGNSVIVKRSGRDDGVYTFSMDDLSPGEYVIRGRATDSVGQRSFSSSFTVVVEERVNELPVVNLAVDPITAPHGALVEFHATATDPDGEIDRVEFYEDSVLLGIQEFGPSDRYTFWSDTLELGEHSVVALAFDDRGAIAVSNSVTVEIVQAGNLPPSVSLDVTHSVTTVGEPVTLVATASDFNGPVTLVEFFEGDVLLGEVAEGGGDQFRLTIDSLGAGEHSIRARATDLDGDVRFSAPVMVSVQLPPNELPQVALFLPVAEVVEGGDVVLNATASDGDGGVAEVAFYAGTTLLVRIPGTAGSEYSFSLNDLPIGEHAITAHATDNRGGEAVSEAVLLSVVAPSGQEPSPVTPEPGQEPNAESPVVREIVVDDQSVVVSIAVNPPSDAVVYVLEEQVPPGTDPTSMSQGGVFNPSTRVITWGPFFDQRERTLSYAIDLPAGGAATVRFEGTVQIDGTAIPIGGAESVEEGMEPLSHAGKRVIDGNVVTLNIRPRADALTYAVEERFPEGVMPLNPNEGGFFDDDSRILRWGPFVDSVPRSFSYELSAVNGLGNLVRLVGVLSVDGVDLPIEGDAEWPSEEVPVATMGAVVRQIESGTVRLLVEPNSEVVVYALEELVPSGLRAVGINEGGVFDEGSNKVKWGPFFDNELRELQYELQSVAGGAEQYQLSGVASFNGSDVAVTGADTLVLATGNVDDGPIHLSFRIVTLPLPGGGVDRQLELEWDSVVGVRYSLEATENLSDGWNAIDVASIVALEETTRLIRPIENSGATLFRVVAP